MDALRRHAAGAASPSASATRSPTRGCSHGARTRSASRWRRRTPPQLTRAPGRAASGFDFAIAEECGRYRECGAYRRLYGDRVLAIEYRRRDFRAACRAVGERISVVLRDRAVTAPGSRTYRYDAC